MQKCSYCGQENDDSAVGCRQCGTSLTEPPLHVPLATPDRMMRHVQQSIWEHFALKGQQFYVAGLVIGLLAGVFGSLRGSEHGFVWWGIPLGAALGLGAAWLLSLVEKFKARVRAKGNPTGLQRAFFVLITFLLIVFVALLIAGALAFFV